MIKYFNLELSKLIVLYSVTHIRAIQIQEYVEYRKRAKKKSDGIYNK